MHFSVIQIEAEVYVQRGYPPLVYIDWYNSRVYFTQALKHGIISG